MFCPDFFFKTGCRFKDTGLWSTVVYINNIHLFLNDKSEKPLEFFCFPYKNIILSFCSFWQPKRDVMAEAIRRIMLGEEEEE